MSFGKKGGVFMTSEELDAINLECDLIDIINQNAWPNGEKLVKILLAQYNISPKDKSRKGRIPAANFINRETL